MIMTASTFTAEDLQDLPRHLKGNLCRCTGYHAIEDAIHGVRTVEVDQPGTAVGPESGPSRARGRHRQGRYTLDTAMEGMLHLKVLRSPHAHARIVSIDKSAALEVPGVHEVFTWEDVPRKLYTTSIHEDFRVDPNDTYMLDNVVRFVGERVAAVVAESRPPPRKGAERSRSSTRSCRPSSIPRRRCELAPAVHARAWTLSFATRSATS